MSIFLEKNQLYLRDPEGGVEDVQAMKEGGFEIILCNVQKEFPPEKWAKIRERARLSGVKCVPWCYIWTLEDLDRLISIGDDWNDGECSVNIEKEIDLAVFSAQEVNERVQSRDVTLICEPWLYNAVDWGPLTRHSMQLEFFFPNAYSPQFISDCRTHAHNKGFECVVNCYGTFDVDNVQPQPSFYDLKTPYSLYTADDLSYIYPNYGMWGPKGEISPCLKLQQLSEAQFPYTGPYYPSPKRPNQGETVIALKIAMHRLKMGYFPNPNDKFGVYLKNALYKYQVSTGISTPTGNYGKRTWQNLRNATIKDGTEYAMSPEALRLVRADV